MVTVTIVLLPLELASMLNFGSKPADASSTFYLNYFIKRLIPSFLMSFITFGLLRYVFHLAKLDNREAVGREFETREKHLLEEQRAGASHSSHRGNPGNVSDSSQSPN